MEGVCNSSLTFLPFSSPTFNEEGSGSFVSKHFNSLTTWFEFFCSAVMILFCDVNGHEFNMCLNLLLVYLELSQHFYVDYLDYLH